MTGASKASWALIVLTMFGCAAVVRANSHGPVFGLATPTNVKHGWSVDFGVANRAASSENTVMTRAMLTYGITEDLQISLSGPVVWSTARLAPGRVSAMMPASGDFEILGAWRFQRRDTRVGARIETTAYGGLIAPGPQNAQGAAGGVHESPGVVAMLASGYASRGQYVWAGVGGSHFGESRGDRRPDMLMFSVVYGYRPSPLRQDYPHWDGRFFVELNGEHTTRRERGGLPVPGTARTQVFLGPSTLWLYKNYGIEGGIQFPIYRRTGSAFEPERYRMAIDFSYFF